MKLDIGCGKNKKPGFIGVDQYAMDGVDLICNLGESLWKVRSVEVGFRPSAVCDGVRDFNQTYEIESGTFTHGQFMSDSVEEVHCSHFIEHLTANERIHFFNELYRVMKPGAKATIITPHWASNRAYGDPTHQWPPVSEMSFYYLNKDWRKIQAPHTDSQWNAGGFNCDFDATWGYSLHGTLHTRNAEFQQFAMQFYKEAAQDMMATLTKK